MAKPRVKKRRGGAQFEKSSLISDRDHAAYSRGVLRAATLPIPERGAAALEGSEITRTFGIRAEDVNEDTNSVAVSFSSEVPVRDFWEPVVLLHEKQAVDLAPLRDVGGVLVNHDADQIVGRPSEVRLDLDARVGRATIVFDEDEDSQKILRKVKSGSLRGISVRYAPISVQEISEGATWESPEKRSFTGPIIVATRWAPREISLTPIPADTTVGVGRKEQGKDPNTMDPRTRAYLVSRGLNADATEAEAYTFMTELETQDAARAATPPVAPAEPEATPPAPTPAPEPEPVPAPALAQRTDVAELTALSVESGSPERLADWLTRGLTSTQARTEVIATLRAANPPAGSPVGSGVEVGNDAGTKREAFAFRSLCGRMNLQYEAGDPGFEARESLGRDVGHVSLPQLALWCLERAGVRGADMLPPAQMIVRAINLSNADFPNILSALANKAVISGYDLTEVTYPQITSRRDFKDFKPVNLSQISEMANFVETPELHPVTETVFTDRGDSYNIATFARKVSLSRQAIINDDLDQLSKITRFGGAFQRTINASVYSILKTNAVMVEDGKALFATDHTSGSNSGTGVPSVTAIGALRTLMRKQKGMDGVTAINIAPTLIIIPPDLDLLVTQILAPMWNANTAAEAALPANYKVTPVVDAELTDVAEYYMSADPNSGSVDTLEVGRLTGQTAPELVRVETHNVLGVEWVAYGDFGTKVVDHRGLAYSTGAA
jgi:phage head maturation protease